MIKHHMYVEMPNIFLNKMCVRRRCTELGIVHRIYKDILRNEIMYSGQNKIEKSISQMCHIEFQPK